MGLRRRARESALQMLYQVDQTAASAEAVFEEFWAGSEVDAELRAFAERLVLGVIDQLDELDLRLSRAAANWRVERMAVVDRNVLRIAVFEMLHESETPPAVIIDEAIEVAKKFGSADSGTFINGILDNVRKRIASEGS